MSYYTKYRPQRIEELDLVSVRQSLSAILTSGKFSHAYLFTGPKGTGKTSSARILAKVLNCEKNTFGSQVVGSTGSVSLHEPCNECENCRRITAGSSLACIEMDAASNRGIDDIRTLKERVGLVPAEGRYTVYIIDEVHMLTTEAFNALLKTLEEPPEHAVFILCTTDPQKIPETVISRCTRVHFFKAKAAEVAGSLAKAIQGEKLDIEPAAMDKITESVDGSFRDAMKLLEQLALQATGTIELSAVLTAVGASQDYDPEKLGQALLVSDMEQALKELGEREASGVDLNVYGKRLLEWIRRQMIAAVTQRDNQMVLRLISLAEVVDQAVVKMKLSALPQLVFEAMAAGWCSREIQNPVSPAIRSNVKVQKVEPKIVEKQVNQAIPNEEKKQPVVVAKDLFAGKLEEVQQRWPQILAAVKPLNHSLEALLRSARPKSVTNGVLQVEAFYKFHKEQLEQDKHRQKLEEAMGSVLGGKILLEIVLGEQQAVKLMPVEDDALVKAAEEIFG